MVDTTNTSPFGEPALPRPLPVEIILRILFLALEDAPVVSNERLEVIGVDKTYFSCLRANKLFAECVKDNFKLRVIIRAGTKVPDDRAVGLFGRLTRAPKADLSGNYSSIVPFDWNAFLDPVMSAETMRSHQWEEKFLKLAALHPTVTIEITHPSQIPAVESGIFREYRPWSSVLEGLRLLQGPLTKFLVETDCGNQEKRLRVEFMPRVPVNDADSGILQFAGSPDTHWKYQPVLQVCVTLSYLSTLTDPSPWNLMRPPNMLIKQPAPYPNESELKAHARMMNFSLRRAFNTIAPESLLISYLSNLGFFTIALRRYQCFDRVTRPLATPVSTIDILRDVNWSPAYLISNLHNLPATTNGQTTVNPTPPADAFAVTPLEPPNSWLVRQWLSPNGVLGQARTETTELAIYVTQFPSLANDHAALDSLISTMEATLRAPNRLPPDLQFIRDGPLAEFWALANAFKSRIKELVQSAYDEELAQKAQRQLQLGLSSKDGPDGDAESVDGGMEMSMDEFMLQFEDRDENDDDENEEDDNDENYDENDD